MNTDSKGRAWYNKIYHKFETILVEVDSVASQGKVSSKSSDPLGLDSVGDEPEKLKDDHCSGSFKIDQHDNGIVLPRCRSSAVVPSDHKCGISQNEELMEGDSLKEKLSGSILTNEKLEEHSNCNQTATTSQASQSTQRSPESLMTAIAFNQDVFFIEDFDAAPLDTIDLYDMTFREDPSDFDDNLLYAARDRSRQLRSFKSKIMDALTSKRIREKEYEQLAIWFGDAEMGCDLMKTKEHATTTSLDSKISQSSVPNTSEDSEWELL